MGCERCDIYCIGPRPVGTCDCGCHLQQDIRADRIGKPIRRETVRPDERPVEEPRELPQPERTPEKVPAGVPLREDER